MLFKQRNERLQKWAARLWPAVLLMLLTAALECAFFNLGGADLHLPFLYGGDGLTGLVEVADMLYGCKTRLGWPLHMDTAAFAPRYDLVYRLFVWACALFTDDAVLIYNLRILCIPIANVLVCYYVLQSLDMRRWLAGAGALTFGLCPYVQYRLGGHQSLAAAEFVPLALLLCLWCREDDRFGRPGKGYFRYRRNRLALLFTWCIANTGMVYYPYFACFFLCLTALCLLLQRQGPRALVAPLLTVGQIVGWLALDFAPTVAGVLLGAGNAATGGIARTKIGADIYSLRMHAMILSPHGFGWARLGRWFQSYFAELSVAERESVNENTMAYVGMVALAGFFVLLVFAFANEEASILHSGTLARRMWLLSRFMVGALLLATMSGFGSVIGMFVRFIRGYNRINPFLVCLAVMAVTLCLEAALQALPAGGKKRVAILGMMLVFAYGLWEQMGFYRVDQSAIQKTWAADAAFGAQMEQAAGEDGLIFQLPYMQSFENGSVNNMQDYALLRSLLHTDTLRFSYGAGIGSENDVWYKTTSELPAADLVAELRSKGFAGIYLDRDGYTDNTVEQALCAAAGCIDPLVSPGGTLVYIPL